jgi:hypothetical protein
MKMMRNMVVALSLILLSAPLIFGQDLSKYRTFSLGTSLAEVSKQVGPYSHYTTLIHPRPAAIQELTFWTLNSSRPRVGVYPVSQILFSFYNGELYRIVVTYDRYDIEGLTDDDMIQAVSARYGKATSLYPESSFFPTNYLDGSTDEVIPSFFTSDSYRSADRVIARWEDSQNSVNLFRSTSRNSFGLAVSSRRLDAQAEAAIFEFEKIEKREAPQGDIDRREKKPTA